MLLALTSLVGVFLPQISMNESLEVSLELSKSCSQDLLRRYTKDETLGTRLEAFMAAYTIGKRAVEHGVRYTLLERETCKMRFVV